ncbi:MAG TPA: ATP-dependent protease subunit HslV [bacterium]|nr:ATP-dependent protease subunit HslV [bacterium]HQL61045.1 ATP-dependent protease subunit HslV [bacterium]
MKSYFDQKWRSTTIVAVRRNGKVVVAGDGQLSLGDTIMKNHARKVRRLYDDRVVVGFAGASADAFTLFEKFEAKLDEYRGNLVRSSVELAKDWRMDRALRHLEALLIVCDEENTLVISGNGDVIEPDEDVIAIGSGGPFAQAAAMALLKFTDMDAASIARESLALAARICVFTNQEFVLEALPKFPEEPPSKKRNSKD